METIDWRLLTLCFSIFTWITGIIGFCIIKWNDMVHLEKKVDNIEGKQDLTIKEVANLSKEVAYLSGRQDIKQ